MNNVQMSAVGTRSVLVTVSNKNRPNNPRRARISHWCACGWAWEGRRADRTSVLTTRLPRATADVVSTVRIFLGLRRLKKNNVYPRALEGMFSDKYQKCKIACQVGFVVLQIEYRPSVVPTNCWELVREFVQGLLGSAVSSQVPQYLQVSPCS
jgi:hypothetical protein